MAFSSLPPELTDLILSYVVPWEWNAEWAVETSFYPVDDATFIEPFGYLRHNLFALRLVSRQFCETMSRELLRKADGEMLREDMEGMNIDGLAALCLAKYDMGPRHRTLPLRRAAALASAFCRWKEARNESFHEELYLKAAFSAMVANNGLDWIYTELELNVDACVGSAPVQPAMDVGGDVELQLLENGGLSMAAFLGDLSTIKALLENGADPNKSQDLYGSPMHAAACAGQVDAMRLLVDAGTDVPLSKGAFGLPLEAAARHGHLGAAQFLVEQNAAIGLALNHALFGGHEAMASFLLSQVGKIDVNATLTADYPRTPIWMAIKYGYRDIALQLCTYPDLDPNEPGPDQRTPLEEADRRQWTDVMRALLSLPKICTDSTDELGREPLHIASARGYDDIVRLLIARDDIDINRPDINNIGPLDYAIREDQHSTIRLLLEHPETRADLDEFQKVGSLETAIRKGGTELVELLLERPEVRSSSPDMRLAMNAAVSSGSMPTILRLVDISSHDPCKVDVDGFSLVDRAVLAGHLDIADFLLGLPGADANSPVAGAAPLCIAALRGRLEVVKYLLSRDDVDVNVMSAYGSPLQCAICREHIEIVRCLLQRDDVDVNISSPAENHYLLTAGCDSEEDGEEAIDSNIEDIGEDLLSSQILQYGTMDSSDGTVWRTPLLSAVRLYLPAIAKLLLDHSDIDPNKADTFGNTPLFDATTLGLWEDLGVEMVRLLLAHPATNPNIIADEEGSSLLLRAARRGYFAIVDLLLQHPRIDPNRADDTGVTPLYYAKYYNRQDIVERLLKHPNTTSAARRCRAGSHHRRRPRRS